MSRRVPVHKVLRSEWTKLRTLPGAWICLSLYVAVVVMTFVFFHPVLTGQPLSHGE